MNPETALLHHGGRASAWGNLGCWPAPAYAEACAALARLHGQAARLKPGAAVLSLGSGGGEELRLWRDEFAAAQVIGIDAGLPWLAPGLRAGSFDAVIAVDAAYHFAPRAAFLASATAALRRSGRLVYSDLVFDGHQRSALRWAGAVAGIDATQIVDIDGALARLRAAGFVDIHIEQLDSEVLDGFANFVAEQTRRLGWRAWHPGWRRPWFTARMLPALRRRGLGYALFSASATSKAERTADSSSGTPARA